MMLQRIVRLKQLFVSNYSAFKERLRLPEKYKGGRIEKWGQFWEALFLDYKTVTMETIKESKAKPRKTMIICSGLGILFTAIKMNPDEQSFYNYYLQNMTDLGMVGDPIRNPTAENHIIELTRFQNQGLLRRMDLLFFSLIWKADYSDECNIYSSQCKYLQPRYLTFYERIIDVGLFNIWWNLKLKMLDFDINPNEWNDQT